MFVGFEKMFTGFIIIFTRFKKFNVLKKYSQCFKKCSGALFYTIVLAFINK
jgi:hypothetical protein